MTWMGTNSTRFCRQKSDERFGFISKRRAERQPHKVSRCASRKPHCESGNRAPVRGESRPDIHRFAIRRNQGMAAEFPMRSPTISGAKFFSARSKKLGMSSGACCPSPSIVSAQVKPSSGRVRQPARQRRSFAAVRWPADHFRARRFRLSAVASVEPSSRTMIFGKCSGLRR